MRGGAGSDGSHGPQGSGVEVGVTEVEQVQGQGRVTLRMMEESPEREGQSERRG